MERLRGALEVTVSALVDRAFATQTAYVHCAHSLSKQARAMSSLNSHLMTVRQVCAPCTSPPCATPLAFSLHVLLKRPGPLPSVLSPRDGVSRCPELCHNPSAAWKGV